MLVICRYLAGWIPLISIMVFPSPSVASLSVAASQHKVDGGSLQPYRNEFRFLPLQKQVDSPVLFQLFSADADCFQPFPVDVLFIENVIRMLIHVVLGLSGECLFIPPRPSLGLYSEAGRFPSVRHVGKCPVSRPGLSCNN